jgi:hypothetical protein
VNRLLQLAGPSAPLAVSVPIALIAAIAAVAFAVGAVCLARAFRTAWRATSHETLLTVLDPRTAAERTEQELTSMLLDGLIEGIHYSSLIGALAQEQSSMVIRSESSAQTGPPPAN